ncbi:heterokaryon incompatibility protein-domain-containing protein [Tricladium varicosporioides]|nr:heterokaryon incompatibility protein-domain-containing protein [Hymenoscyphus varicosporioides]
MACWKHNYNTLKDGPSEFRLVTIHRGVRPNYIVASLDTYPLNDHPPYQALSYVWGSFDLEDPCIIELDECRFEVTTNLWRALYYLRSEKEEVKFWIDAICINQEDLDERSSQVQLMRDIYRGAGRTIVWLGDESFWSLRLFEFLESVSTTRGWKDDGERQLALKRQKELHGLLAANEEIQKIVERGLYGDIAQRDFWERIWIVQEVAISSGVMIYCGPDKMAWQEFCNAIWNLDQASNITMTVDNPNFGGLPNLETIGIIRELLSRHAKLTLGDALASLRRSKATDPRDMVYGLLGLLPNIPIRPDYLTASPQDVYLSLVEYCIIEEKSLDIITLCRKATSNLGLPSWVPDWTESWTRPDDQQDSSWDVANIDLPPFQLILRYGSGELLRAFSKFKNPDILRNIEGTELQLTAWSSHGSSDPVATISKSSSVLVASGIYVGLTTQVGNYCYRDDEDDGDLFFFEVFSNWEEIMLDRFGICKDGARGKTIVDVFDQCLDILDRHLTRNEIDFEEEKEKKFQKRKKERAQREEKYPPSEATYYGNISIVEAFVRTIFTDLDAEFQRVTSTKYNKFWDIDGSESTEWAHEVWASQMSTNRRLFITDNGYIGLGPVKMRKGDQICILYGCSVPIVLRKVNGGVILVGEAYLHGLMDGEALALVEEKIFFEMEWSIF